MEKSNSMPTKVLNEDNSEITSDREIAREFNNFFTNIGPKLAEKTPPSNKLPTDFMSMHINVFEPIDEIRYKEMEKAFSSLKAGKSPGYDAITPDIVKFCSSKIINPLTHIFSLSFRSGIVPEKLKIAKETPVFKSDEKIRLTSYRPISVLPVFSK